MEDPPAAPLLTPASIRGLLDTHGLRPSRALGQNFLADPNTARRIVALADVGDADAVLEIGPGLGSLTLALADAGADVVALEMDRHLLGPLRGVVGHRARVVEGDATVVDLAALLDESFPGTAPVRSVSNLPYNVATHVVIRLLQEIPRVQDLLVMVQREVGQRLAAGPGSKDYGAVSLKVAYHAEARLVGDVAPTVFVPRPKVDSALVRITRRPRPSVDVADPAAMFELVRAGFGQRRKMLRRSLVPVLGADTGEMLLASGIDPSARAETLGLEEWASLARVVGDGARR